MSIKRIKENYSEKAGTKCKIQKKASYFSSKKRILIKQKNFNLKNEKKNTKCN